MEEHRGLTMDAYLAIPAISRSMIMVFEDSPEMYAGRYVTGEIPSPEPTPKQVFGSTVDAFATEGVEPSDEPPEGVEILPAAALTKNGTRKSDWRKHVTNGPTWWTPREVAKHEEQQAATRAILYRIRDQIEAHRAARSLIYDEGRVCQPSYVFGINGMACKCRPDVYHPGSGTIVDIKCSASTRPRFFCSRVLDYGYHVQAAMCLAALAERQACTFINVVIRDSPPYDVECYEMSDKFLAIGTDLLFSALQGINNCQLSKRWRSKSHGRIVELDPPRYAETRSEFQL